MIDGVCGRVFFYYAPHTCCGAGEQVQVIELMSAGVYATCSTDGDECLQGSGGEEGG